MSLRGALDRALRSVSSLHRQGSKPDVFLISTPRSGSTWLLETIVAERGMRPCNEPFNIRKPFIRSRLGIADWDTLASVHALPKVERYLERLSAGCIGYGFRNPRPFEAGYDVRTDRTAFKILFACEDRLDWLRQRFRGQIVCLVRHPIPVSLSRQQLPRLPALLRSARWLSAEQRSLAERIAAHGNGRERALLDWCLQNRPVFDFFAEADLFLTYEQMVLEPRVVVDRLIEMLDLASVERVQRSVERLSGSVSRSSEASVELLRQRKENAHALIAKWRQQVSEAEERALMTIAAELGIDAYRSGELLPHERYWLGGRGSVAVGAS